jgi:hypothetical protein
VELCYTAQQLFSTSCFATHLVCSDLSISFFSGIALAKRPVRQYVQLNGKEIMKKVMLAVCLMFGGATLVSAQQTDRSATQSQTQSMQDQDQKGQQISASELPEEVTAKLESQDYSGWTVGNAYKKSDASMNNMEVYVVELKKGTETKKVKFDKDGNKLDKEGAHGQKQYNKGQTSEQGQADQQSADQIDNQN